MESLFGIGRQTSYNRIELQLEQFESILSFVTFCCKCFRFSGVSVDTLSNMINMLNGRKFCLALNHGVYDTGVRCPKSYCLIVPMN